MSDTPTLRLRAHAKINWTMEVLSARADGYHEVRTILQTVDLCDQLAMRPDDALSLRCAAAALAGEPIERNLAYRAAALFAHDAGPGAFGARIDLVKRVPVAAGLGGGSSDAAAALRGMRSLHAPAYSDAGLEQLAAQLGADVPFFLRGGAALATGRGELLQPLPDGPRRRLVVAWPKTPPPPDKTARMYAALTKERYTGGARTEQLAARLGLGRPVRDEDLCNVFESIARSGDAHPGSFAQATGLGLGRPHLCGSGPAFYFLLDDDQPSQPIIEPLQELSFAAIAVHTVSAAETTASDEAR